MAYQIIEKDFTNKTCRVIRDSVDLCTATDECENLALQFVVHHEGNKYKDIKPHFYIRSPSRKWGKINREGYFVTKNSDGFSKYTIYKKVKSPGLIYSTTEIKKIKYFEIAKKLQKTFVNKETLDLTAANDSIEFNRDLCEQVRAEVGQFPYGEDSKDFLHLPYAVKESEDDENNENV